GHALGAVAPEAARILVAARPDAALLQFLGGHRGGAASHGASARPVSERGADPPAHGRVPDAGLLSRGSGRSGAPGAATASDPVQWVAAHAGRRGVVEWARPSSRARAVRRRGE